MDGKEKFSIQDVGRDYWSSAGNVLDAVTGTKAFLSYDSVNNNHTRCYVRRLPGFRQRQEVAIDTNLQLKRLNRQPSEVQQT